MSTPTPNHSDESAESTEELAAQLEILQEENSRLRAEYTRAKKATYRRTAIALGGIGVFSLSAAVVLPTIRRLLIVLGAIGIFGGVLTYYLTPERVVTVDVSESIYNAHHAVGNQLVDELGLTDTRIYLPVRDEVRLFIPKHREFELPTENSLFITNDDSTRGVTLRPTGESLATELRTATPSGTNPPFVAAIRQAGDAVVEQFEIADHVDITTDASDAETKVIIEISGAAFGRLSKFDHPIVSMIGTTAADELDTAIRVNVMRQSDSFVATYERLEKPPHQSEPSSTLNTDI